MRKISFRGWHKEEKRMFAVSELRWENGDLWVCEEILHPKGVGVHPLKVVDLMQLTGLSDKSGKDIYEGDIVHFPDITFEVTWDDYSKGFKFGEGSWNPGWLHGRCEIIGNIHENESLLK